MLASITGVLVGSESSGWNGSAARAFALELAEWNALVMLAFLWVAALGVVKHQSRAIDVAACVLHDITGQSDRIRIRARRLSLTVPVVAAAVPTSLLILVMHWATHAKVRHSVAIQMPGRRCPIMLRPCACAGGVGPSVVGVCLRLPRDHHGGAGVRAGPHAQPLPALPQALLPLPRLPGCLPSVLGAYVAGARRGGEPAAAGLPAAPRVVRALHLRHAGHRLPHRLHRRMEIRARMVCQVRPS